MQSANSPESVHLRFPENPSLLNRLRTAFRCLQILKDHPGDTIAAPLLNACIDHTAYQRILEQLQQTDEGRDLLARRPSLQGDEVDLPTLTALPEHTLGHQYARYYRDNGIVPFHTENPINDDLDYIAKRYRETHDLYHVVTGYQTDPHGEMELQAFVMGNIGIRTPLIIVPMGSLGILRNKLDQRPGHTPTGYLREIREAYRRGRRARSFFSFPFEAHWETPLDEVRGLLLGAGGESVAAQPA